MGLSKAMSLFSIQFTYSLSLHLGSERNRQACELSQGISESQWPSSLHSGPWWPSTVYCVSLTGRAQPRARAFPRLCAPCLPLVRCLLVASDVSRRRHLTAPGLRLSWGTPLRCCGLLPHCPDCHSQRRVT